MIKLNWSGKGSIPMPGDTVSVRLNGHVTPAEVLELRAADGGDSGHYVGLWVQLETPPDWYVKQNEGNVPCLVFGIDLQD